MKRKNKSWKKYVCFFSRKSTRGARACHAFAILKSAELEPVKKRRRDEHLLFSLCPCVIQGWHIHVKTIFCWSITSVKPSPIWFAKANQAQMKKNILFYPASLHNLSRLVSIWRFIRAYRWLFCSRAGRRLNYNFPVWNTQITHNYIMDAQSLQCHPVSKLVNFVQTRTELFGA
jgi:hypothetical protein